MAANPSKIIASASQQDKNSSNDSKTLSELEQAKLKQEFEQFQHNLLVMKPALVPEDSQEFQPFSTIFPLEITNITISYMREAEIPPLGAIARPILFACRSEIYKIMEFKRLVTEKLLPHVFGANPGGVEAFLRTPGIHPKILLTESHYTEGYNSQKSKGFVCFRRYKAVSALVGAYRCADGPFLGRRILAYLLRDNNLPHNVKEGLLCEARQQLSELLALIETAIFSTETANTKISEVTTMAKANVGAAAASAATAVSPNDTAGNKEKAEFNSGSSANTDEFADSLEFLSAIKKLINAYNAYISQYDSLAKQNKWTEIDTLWGQVCEYHKRIYHYVKLEFFGPIPFSPLPEFDLEPPRGACLYLNNDLLDLDEIGFDTGLGLYKECAGGVLGVGGPFGEGHGVGGQGAAALDQAAISHLYKLRVDDLRNTIGHLHSLESALTFINDVKPSLRIDL
jgi:hypothetical protein